MRNTFILFLLLALLISCGAKHRVVEKEQQKTETVEKVKTDSTATKTDSVAQTSTENKIIENNTVSVDSTEIWGVTFTPPAEASPSDTAKTVKFKVKTPKGNYEYEAPKGYGINVKGESGKKTETKVGKETSQKKDEAKITSSEVTDVSRETSKKANTQTSSKNVDVKKSEPISFNLGFWLFLLILIILIVAYLKFVKKII